MRMFYIRMMLALPALSYGAPVAHAQQTISPPPVVVVQGGPIVIVVPARLDTLANVSPIEGLQAGPEIYVTHLSVRVDVQGMTSDCDILSGSGSKKADQAACARVLKSNFAPARNSLDRKVADVWRGWVSPNLQNIESSAVRGAHPNAPKSAVPSPVGTGRKARAMYPPKAARLGQEGIVYYAAKISGEGRAIACEVTVSSGYPDLDDAVCPNIIKSARFNPAYDEQGRAITSAYASRVVWKLRNGKPESSLFSSGR